MTRVFLGGTWNGSPWREELIPMLRVDYFNPIVDNWTPECQEEELKQRKLCDFVLYVITKEMSGVYSIAEAVDDSNKRPKSTLFCVIEDGFSDSQVASLNATKKMIESNGGLTFDSLEKVAIYLNSVNDLST